MSEKRWVFAGVGVVGLPEGHNYGLWFAGLVGGGSLRLPGQPFLLLLFVEQSPVLWPAGEGAPCSLCLSLQPQGACGFFFFFSRQCFFLQESQEGGGGEQPGQDLTRPELEVGERLPGLQPEGGSL